MFLFLVFRIFWILTLCTVYACCTLFIVQGVIHFLTSKPVITMENTPTAVGNIPFPAVTICSSNQVKPSVFNISSYFLLNEEDRQNLSDGWVRVSARNGPKICHQMDLYQSVAYLVGLLIVRFDKIYWRESFPSPQLVGKRSVNNVRIWNFGQLHW